MQETPTDLSKIKAALEAEGYRINSKLGEGAFGYVFHAISPKKEEVAVKVLIDTEQESIERFKRETRISNQLKSPYALKCGHLKTRSGFFYFEMPFADQGSLRRLSNEGLDVHGVIVIGLNISHVLMELHNKGGFHRDIKPDNILIKGTTVYLADFGLARLPYKHGSNLTNSSQGTQEYLAPEVKGDEGFTPRSDIYSLGITLLELITTNPKPSKPNIKIAKGKNQALGSIIEAMIEDNPSKRPSATEVHEQLNEIIANKNIKKIALIFASGVAAGITITYIIHKRQTTASPQTPSTLETQKMKDKYLITHVKKSNHAETIEEVRIQASPPYPLKRHAVISLIRTGNDVFTSPPTGQGAQVHVINVKGVDYLRTNHNKEESDNLGELPLF